MYLKILFLKKMSTINTLNRIEGNYFQLHETLEKKIIQNFY